MPRVSPQNAPPAQMLQTQPEDKNCPDTPFGAVVARQLSVWPFGAQTARLFVLVDPSLPDQSFRQGLLRAMQQAYFRTDGCSQTRAVSQAALAAHYVLRQRNRDLLPGDQVNAATAVAALRGHHAFVALAGDAAAFAWRDGALTGQRRVLRLARPLGLEQDPRLTLWSTPLDAGDRLILVCGATWRPEAAALIEDVMSSASASTLEEAESQLATALSGSRPAGVRIIGGRGERRSKRHLTLVVPPNARVRPSSAASSVIGRDQPSRRRGVARSGLRWFSSLLGLSLLGVAALAAINPAVEPPRLSVVRQAQTLLAQADQTGDLAQAHALVASALDVAQRADAAAPGQYADLVVEVGQKLDAIDHVAPVTTAMVVQLGPSGRNVVDLAVGDHALYTLDVVESTVRAFALDGAEQQPSPDTILARPGVQIASGPRRLATPVAIQYLPGASPDQGVLAIVDSSRSVVQVGADRALSARMVPSSAAWRELGALGSDAAGHLFVLDSGAHQLLEYPALSERVVDPPRLLLDGATAPGLPFERAAQVVGAQDQVFLRLDDGSLERFDDSGGEQQIVVQPPDGPLTSVGAIAPDRAGGLYVADPANSRILHTSADGALLAQLRNPSLGGVRQIQSSPDGRRLYGLVTSGVLSIDLPGVEPSSASG